MVAFPLELLLALEHFIFNLFLVGGAFEFVQFLLGLN
jgi:hypothetical protein